MSWIKVKRASLTGLVVIVSLAKVAVGQSKQPITGEIQQRADGLRISTNECILTLEALTDGAIRVRCAKADTGPSGNLILLQQPVQPKFKVAITRDAASVATAKLTARYDRNTGTLSFTDNTGRVLLKEVPGARKLTPSMVGDESTNIAEDSFVSPATEHLFGSGQFQDGFLDIRDLPRRLTQVNTQIAIPFFLSSEGYGVLWHNYGLTDLNPAGHQIPLAPVAAEERAAKVSVTTSEGTQEQVRREGEFAGELNLPSAGKYAFMLDIGQAMAQRYHVEIDGKLIVDYANPWLPPTTSWFSDLSAGRHTLRVLGNQKDKPSIFWRPAENRTVLRSPVADAVDFIVFGSTPDEAIAGYRQVTGEASLLPIWAYGYIHCRERFHSSEEILKTADEFRARNIPVDVMVQDWQYWGKYGWNAMRFDEADYPDPAGMIAQLHAKHMELMVSVWSKIDPKSEVGQQFAEHHYYIPGTEWVDFFNPAAAQLYWTNFRDRLVKLGIDAWWLDAAEPENDDLHGRRVATGLGDRVRLVYPYLVNKTVYEGLRKDEPEKRVFILTRSAFPGEQRFGTAVWSGDVGSDFDVLKRQVTAGLGYAASGMPYWTTDGGGFFRPGPSQYNDPKYTELFQRWFQFATFSPLLRVHGYQTNTEPWNFGSDVEKQFKSYDDLRSRLLPYIYSEAANITFKGSTLMRPLVMDFAGDNEALKQKAEYMFGPAFLVAPVLEAGAKQWPVYAPKTAGGWYDFWTGTPVAAGATSERPAPLDRIPLLVRAGSVVPLGPVKQYAAEKVSDDLEVRVYTGADGQFSLYEDQGTNYAYEQGSHASIPLRWNDRTRTFEAGARVGSYPGMVISRRIHVVAANSKSSCDLTYTGKLVSCHL